LGILKAWRAATLCPFGGVDMFPSLEAMLSNGQARTLQAIELESGIGRQWRLWKWASYCASEVNSRTVLMLLKCFFAVIFNVVWYVTTVLSFFKFSYSVCLCM
jgi:hypothetical protein